MSLSEWVDLKRPPQSAGARLTPAFIVVAEGMVANVSVTSMRIYERDIFAASAAKSARGSRHMGDIHVALQHAYHRYRGSVILW
jgi:hypothetical protein